MKRLYVFNRFRGEGIGKKLCEKRIEKGRVLGYKKMRPDTQEQSAEANRLYERTGFYEIHPYRENPMPGAKYMELMI